MGIHGDHIAQASKIRIVTDIPLPMQVDGEPTLLLPSDITIDLKNQAKMITNSEKSILQFLDGPKLIVDAAGDICDLMRKKISF
jgi:hypothetical protein